MGETGYSKFLTVLLVIIIVAVIGLGGYVGFTYFVNHKRTNDANKFVSNFVEEVENNDGTNQNTDVGENNGNVLGNIETADVGTSNDKKTYYGFNVIGTIEIPKTNVEYPILEDPPTTRKLELAVSALYPRYAQVNQPGNIVIVGHNYRNGTFFSNNKKLVNGDKVYITGLDKKKVTYVIYNVFQTTQDDTKFYNRDTNGAMEITLSTCTDASDDKRIIVFAKAE